MAFFRSRFYRINVILLSIIGQWPHQKFKSWKLFQQLMCQVSVITLMTCEMTKLLEVWGNLDIMIECLSPMGVQLVATIKTTNCMLHRKHMTKLLEIMKNDWSALRNEEELQILTRYAEKGRNLIVIYTALVLSSVFIYLLVPLTPTFLDVVAPLNQSRETVYLYHTQYYVDPEKYYIPIFLHTYSGTLITVTSIVAIDAMFFCYVMHVCGILAVIGHRLENLTFNSPSTDAGGCVMSKDDDDRCYREIILCIDHHYKTTEVIKIIESTYSMSYLLILGVSIILLSISSVEILIKFGQVGEMIRLIQFNVGQLIHLLFNSWPCQKLIDESLNFRESLYAAEWYSLSEANKHILKFAMLRTLQLEKIVAGKLYVMSMENFGVVVQTSMSYFTVFASIR